MKTMRKSLFHSRQSGCTRGASSVKNNVVKVLKQNFGTYHINTRTFAAKSYFHSDLNVLRINTQSLDAAFIWTVPKKNDFDFLIQLLRFKKEKIAS